MVPNSKKPWENYPTIWKSEAEFIAFLRGGIRKALWNRYPIKIEFNKKNRKRIKNPNPRGRAAEVYGGTCYLCRQDFIQSDLQIDHITGNHKFTAVSDIETYITALLFVNDEDLAHVCKPCHKIKSYAERYNMTFEQARVKKELIAFNKNALTKQLQTLKSLGLKPEKETKKACGEAFEEYLKQREEN